jgi:glutamine amidotransferase-like uncharacterized protein
MMFVCVSFSATFQELTYAEIEVMKLVCPIKVDVPINANDGKIKDIIINDFTTQPQMPGGLHFRKDLISKLVTDPLVLSEIESTISSLWAGSFKVIAAEKHVTASSSLPIIYVYKDSGISDLSANVCVDALTTQGKGLYNVQLIDAAGVINGNLTNAVAFVIPGGADREFCKKLNSIGNSQIKRFVENGGTYIGFCAGAYYAASKCVFVNTGGNVVESRELGFYQGEAIGPILAEYSPTSRSGVRIAAIKLVDATDSPEKIYHVYYNGGCCFEGYSGDDVKIIAYYANKADNVKGRAAIIECKVGKGLAILSGIHPECSAENMQQLRYTIPTEAFEYLATEIFPRLADCSHVAVMAILMEKIQAQKARTR